MSLLTTLLSLTRQPPREHARRAVLIGSPGDIRNMRRVLRSAPDSPHAVGCIPLSPQRRAGVLGLRVLGGIDDLPAVARVWSVGVAYLSIPVAMHGLAASITAQLGELGIAVRRMATLDDQLHGRTAAGAAAGIDISQLLDRPARPLDESAITAALRGKRVLITGAGGSIGSHIARIVARFGPESILLMERSENGLFEIDRQLAGEFPGVPRRKVLADVTDARRTMDLVMQYRPHVVYHAAAHKHVPMMEDHPREAMVNNFFGTKSIADAAAAARAERFVMISTDKAVHPTSVMGATKRTAELYVQSLAARSSGFRVQGSGPPPTDLNPETQNPNTPTLFCMVRFGNVLGSACSVVPIWSKQLSEGGPVTVTDPRMTRYFMTIPEAAALVIQASCLADETGAIFVLDMGEPIRIVELAQRFIAMHGLEAGRDMEIVFTGARPGEKLHEQLSYDSEDVTATSHEAVRRLRSGRVDAGQVSAMVDRFELLRDSDDAGQILAALRDAVPMQASEQSHTAGSITPGPLSKSA